MFLNFTNRGWFYAFMFPWFSHHSCGKHMDITHSSSAVSFLFTGETHVLQVCRLWDGTCEAQS